MELARRSSHRAVWRFRTGPSTPLQTQRSPTGQRFFFSTLLKGVWFGRSGLEELWKLDWSQDSPKRKYVSDPSSSQWEFGSKKRERCEGEHHTSSTPRGKVKENQERDEFWKTEEVCNGNDSTPWAQHMTTCFSAFPPEFFISLFSRSLLVFHWTTGPE